MKLVFKIFIISATLFLFACGGGGSSSGKPSDGSSANSQSSSSVAMVPTVPAENKDGREKQLNFFLGNAAIDLREITLSEAYDTGSVEFVESWFFYHDYFYPQLLYSNWVSPNYDGKSHFPFEIRANGDVSYLVLQREKTPDNQFKMYMSSFNYMNDDVDFGDYCYLNSQDGDFNSAFNSVEFERFNGGYDKGTLLEYVPAHNNVGFEGAGVPNAPKLVATVNGKKIAFFLYHNPENSQNDGRYVLGIHYDGVYHTEEEYLLAAEDNDFESTVIDIENKVALNLRTTRFEQGAVNAFNIDRLVKCSAEPLARSGIKMDKVFETPFHVLDGFSSKAFIHIADDGLVSVFNDDIDGLNNCYNAGFYSRRNAEIHGNYAKYNREGNYISIEGDLFNTLRLILDTENNVAGIWGFDSTGKELFSPTSSYENGYFAISTTIATISLSDLVAGTCSTQQ